MSCSRWSKRGRKSLLILSRWQEDQLPYISFMLAFSTAIAISRLGDASSSVMIPVVTDASYSCIHTSCWMRFSKSANQRGREAQLLADLVIDLGMLVTNPIKALTQPISVCTRSQLAIDP